MLEPSSTLWSIGVVSFYGSAEAGEQPSGVRSERVGQIVDAVDALRSCRSDRFGREREVAPVVQMIERRHRQQDVQSARHCVPGEVVVQSGEVRSEEHTSELQLLMRISYAVFCLQKKKT